MLTNCVQLVIRMKKDRTAAFWTGSPRQPFGCEGRSSRFPINRCRKQCLSQWKPKSSELSCNDFLIKCTGSPQESLENNLQHVAEPSLKKKRDCDTRVTEFMAHSNISRRPDLRRDETNLRAWVLAEWDGSRPPAIGIALGIAICTMRGNAKKKIIGPGLAVDIDSPM